MSIFFLMCSERSGSNFITKLLNGHKNICGPSTKHVINPVARNLFRYGNLSDSKNWDMLLEDIYSLMSVDFSVWRKKFTISDLRDIAPVGDIKSLIRNIYLDEARENGKQHVFIKENHVYEFLPFLLMYFPESKFLYQTRDPRDMALSWKKNSDHPGGVVKAARQWKHDQQQSLKNFHLLKSFGKADFVRYEDLTANAEVEIDKVLRFFGLPYDDGIFDFHKDEITLENAKKQKAWDNLSKSIIKDNSKKYEAELSVEEVMTIEKICWFEMLHLGYRPDYSEKDLEAVTEYFIEEINRKELKDIVLARSIGVKENMAAKSRFYQR